MRFIQQAWNRTYRPTLQGAFALLFVASVGLAVEQPPKPAPKTPADLASLLGRSPEQNPDVMNLRAGAAKDKADAEKLFLDASRKKDEAKLAAARAFDFGPALEDALNAKLQFPPKDAKATDLTQPKDRRNFVLHTDFANTVKFVVSDIAATHARMGLGDRTKDYQPRAFGELKGEGKSELPLVEAEAKRGEDALKARIARADSFVGLMQSSYWGIGDSLKHDCQIFTGEGVALKAELDKLPNDATATGKRWLLTSIMKADGNRDCPTDNKNGTLAAVAAESKLLGTLPPEPGAEAFKPFEGSDTFAFVGYTGKKPLTHDTTYLAGHRDPMFAHGATLRLNFAFYQKDSRLTLPAGSFSNYEDPRRDAESLLERFLLVPSHPLHAFFTVFDSLPAHASGPPAEATTQFFNHFVNAERFATSLSATSAPSLPRRHFFEEAAGAFKEAEKQSREALVEAKVIYEKDVNRYRSARNAAEKAISDAEQKLRDAENKEKAANNAAKNASNQGGENKDDKGKGGGGGGQKGGGGGGEAGQRAQLTPPQDAKIPNQTAFPDFQFPQRPEETGIDPRLVDLATRGAASNAALGDLAVNPLTGGQVFQGAQGNGNVTRNPLNFNPRNLLARGVPRMQPGDAPGGAINNGGGAADAAAAAAAGGASAPPLGKGGGGGDGGGLGGNFENGIGYDPNGGEGARQRQTFTEFVSYSAGADGGSSSNGDSGPPVSAQIAGLPGGGAGEAIFMGPQGKRGAKGNDKKVAAVGILSYVTNLSPLLGDRVKKIEFKEAFAKANAAAGNRDPASLNGVSPSLASPSSGLGGRIEDAARREGDSTAL